MDQFGHKKNQELKTIQEALKANQSPPGGRLCTKPSKASRCGWEATPAIATAVGLPPTRIVPAAAASAAAAVRNTTNAKERERHAVQLRGHGAFCTVLGIKRLSIFSCGTKKIRFSCGTPDEETPASKETISN